MRPPLKVRRSVAKHSWVAPIDRATGEVLEPQEPIVWICCRGYGWVDENEDGTDHIYDMCGYGRSTRASPHSATLPTKVMGRIRPLPA
jgi:hypothetical protein